MIYFNLSFLIVFAINILWISFKRKKCFLKLFFILFEISYFTLYLWTFINVKWEKGILYVFYIFSAISVKAQATIFNFYASFWIYRWRYGSPSQSSLAGKTIESVTDSSVDEKTHRVSWLATKTGVLRIFLGKTQMCIRWNRKEDSKKNRPFTRFFFGNNFPLCQLWILKYSTRFFL